jgi:predicted acyl esterase
MKGFLCNCSRGCKRFPNGFEWRFASKICSLIEKNYEFRRFLPISSIQTPFWKAWTLGNAYFVFLVFLLSAICPVFSEELKPDLQVMIPMRDGTELQTDLYLPTPDSRGLPCILLRSPSGRDVSWKGILELAQAGYVIAVQETRSAKDLEGKTLPFVSDAWGKLQDGYDVVEWLAKSPYTNGKIGTWGPSALGITQLLLAPTQPPSLKCQYVIFAASSLYHHGIFSGGQLLKNQAEGWLGYYARDTGVLSYVCQRPFYNDFWKQLNTLDVVEHVKVPGFFVAGWYDTFLQGTLDAFYSRQYEGGEGAKGHQKLIIGPWTHFWPRSTHFGDFEIPKNGEIPPFDILPKRWFDYYLKGVDNGMEKIPAVIYYVMGPFDGTPSSGNRWKTSDVWPVPATRTSLYLSSDHKLHRDPSLAGQLSYKYDPHNTISTIGGRNLFLESGPKDQRSIEGREDILVFTTEPLSDEMEITGPLSAILYFNSDQKDTDVVVRLCDVYPDGRSVLITEGGYRLGTRCYLTGEAREFKPGVPTEVVIDLSATSLVFAKGHSVRLSVSSSNFPRLEKNLNVGVLGANSGESKVAKNVLHVGEKYPSRLILPVVPTENYSPKCCCPSPCQCPKPCQCSTSCQCQSPCQCPKPCQCSTSK